MDGEAGGERREPTATRLELDPDPRRLRESIAQLDEVLADLERDAARKVRLLVAEVIARAFDAHRRPRGLIRLDIIIGPSAVRLEASGDAFLMPSEVGDAGHKLDELLPYWVLEDLADRWGLDRRTARPTMWFMISCG